MGRNEGFGSIGTAWPVDANGHPRTPEVTLMVECPSRLVTMAMSAPDEIISDAAT